MMEVIGGNWKCQNGSSLHAGGNLCYLDLMDRIVLQGTGYPYRQPAFEVIALLENLSS